MITEGEIMEIDGAFPPPPPPPELLPPPPQPDTERVSGESIKAATRVRIVIAKP